MRFLDLEASGTAYRADFAVYGLAVTGLAVLLAGWAPGPGWPLVATAVAGYLLWSLLEYGLHRFVLHGLQPFQGMHEQHHRRPAAFIGTPTVVSAPLFVALVFMPAWWLAGAWQAGALMLGLLAGYLAYALTHHVCHHTPPTAARRSRSAWLVRHQGWHASHHRRLQVPGCYGVSHRFWDHVFGTARLPRHGRDGQAAGGARSRLG